MSLPAVVTLAILVLTAAFTSSLGSAFVSILLAGLVYRFYKQQHVAVVSAVPSPENQRKLKPSSNQTSKKLDASATELTTQSLAENRKEFLALQKTLDINDFLDSEHCEMWAKVCISMWGCVYAVTLFDMISI